MPANSTSQCMSRENDCVFRLSDLIGHTVRCTLYEGSTYGYNTKHVAFGIIRQ